MRKKHAQTLRAIFHEPVLSSVKWKDVEALFVALGARIEEGSGSRVRILLKNQVAVFHRPHPRKETDKGALVSVKKFLLSVGILP
jgi:HicA toxin of bacterial toxin-antitoxin,